MSWDKGRVGSRRGGLTHLRPILSPSGIDLLRVVQTNKVIASWCCISSRMSCGTWIRLGMECVMMTPSRCVGTHTRRFESGLRKCQGSRGLMSQLSMCSNPDDTCEECEMARSDMPQLRESRTSKTFVLTTENSMRMEVLGFPRAVARRKCATCTL